MPLQTHSPTSLPLLTVPGPAFAIASMPGLSKRTVRSTSSSNSFSQMLLPPVPSPRGSPLRACDGWREEGGAGSVGEGGAACRAEAIHARAGASLRGTPLAQSRAQNGSKQRARTSGS